MIDTHGQFRLHIFWLSAYRMEVIQETRRTHYIRCLCVYFNHFGFSSRRLNRKMSDSITNKQNECKISQKPNKNLDMWWYRHKPVAVWASKLNARSIMISRALKPSRLIENIQYETCKDPFQIKSQHTFTL